MPRVAFMTFAILAEPHGHPAVAGFDSRLHETFVAAEANPGFIARSKLISWVDGLPKSQLDWGRWGPYRRTALYPEPAAGEDREASTLSLWRDLESVFAFTYLGAHGDALQLRGEWFRTGDWPSHVAWWVADHVWPNWTEAARRLEYLHANGPTAFGFTLQRPFDVGGDPRPGPTLGWS